jgi:hypothetical protein
VSRYLLLDSGPLGLVTQPRISPEVVAMNHWLIDRLSSGDAVLVPAIIYYELRRELLRARKASGLARLDAFAQSDPNGYLALTDEARSRALGKSLPAGTPYGPALDLDIDCHPCRPGARSRRPLSSPPIPAIFASSWMHVFGMT